MSYSHTLSAAFAVFAVTVSGPALAAPQDSAPQAADTVLIPLAANIMIEHDGGRSSDGPQSCLDLLMSEPGAGNGGACVSDESLADLRGGETILVGNQTLTAITAGNILNGDYFAGNVSLSDNALSNFTGIGNLVINTGAQVSLQAGMNLVINTGP